MSAVWLLKVNKKTRAGPQEEPVVRREAQRHFHSSTRVIAMTSNRGKPCQLGPGNRVSRLELKPAAKRPDLGWCTL
jgi:hypothetical protein